MQCVVVSYRALTIDVGPSSGVQNPVNFKVCAGYEYCVSLCSIDDVVASDPDLYAISWCGTKWEDYNTESVFNRYSHTGARFLNDKQRVFKLWEGVIGHPSLRLLDGAKRVLKQRRLLRI